MSWIHDDEQCPTPAGSLMGASCRPLSLQLYTLREPMAADPSATWDFIGGLGLTYVEPHRIVDTDSRTLLKEACQRYGLTIPSAHTRFIGEDQDAVFSAARQLGIERVIQPNCPRQWWENDEGIACLAHELNEAASCAADYGVRVGYHNHAFEYEHLDRPLERLADKLTPEVSIELDTYWAAVGAGDGGEAVRLLEQLSHIVNLIHVKDGPISADPLEQLPLGEGRMPVREILQAAPDALAVLEMDAYSGGICQAVQQCVAYMKEES